VLIEAAPELGYRVEEGVYRLPELLAADEAFTSSSVREVMPVAAVDGTQLELGEAAGALQAALRALT
jgi:branched-subunit amino acid aminotransferase/4-amino-4-deoxychorismate lyase